MSQGTGIQWTDCTWNPVAGCTPVSAGCANCYATTMTHRLAEMAGRDKAKGRDPGRKANYIGLTVLKPNGRRRFNGTVRCVEDALLIPLGWKKPRRVFVNSMSDLFHADVPFEFIGAVHKVMAACPQHTFQILTKRPERAVEFYTWLRDHAVEVTYGLPTLDGRGCDPDALHDQILDDLKGVAKNRWLGTSVENQKAADERIPHLLRCSASVRFLSCEPLLGEVRLPLKPWTLPQDERPVWERIAAATDEPRIDWVIAGGESGADARPCVVEWLRGLRDQCKAAGVPFFAKQVGKRPFVHFYTTDDALREWALERERCVWHDNGSGKLVKWDASDGQPRSLGFIEARLDDSHGGDESEWPADLRVREFPGAGS